jgi:hypothetical protein
MGRVVDLTDECEAVILLNDGEAFSGLGGCSSSCCLRGSGVGCGRRLPIVGKGGWGARAHV